MNKYEIWMSGYLDQGMEGVPAKASRILRNGEIDSKWEGITFQQACVKALNELKWPMLYEGLQGLGSCYYDASKNTYWAMSFYETESEARKIFG